MIDYNTLPLGALLRSPEFLRPEPVPVDAIVAGGRAPASAVWKGRLTARKWADIWRFLAHGC